MVVVRGRYMCCALALVVIEALDVESVQGPHE